MTWDSNLRCLFLAINSASSISTSSVWLATSSSPSSTCWAALFLLSSSSYKQQTGVNFLPEASILFICLQWHKGMSETVTCVTFQISPMTVMKIKQQFDCYLIINYKGLNSVQRSWKILVFQKVPMLNEYRHFHYI